MRRGIALACLLLVAVPSARALQLGDLSIQSRPGEPLVAEIAVDGSDRIDLTSAVVELAGDRAHAAAGINPQTLPPSLGLRIVGEDPEGIRLTTRTPFEAGDDGLEFLVVLTWPDGRLVRGYGIERDGTMLRASSGSDLRYGPTRATDTLYSIAETVRPEAVATNQMMLALLEENPGSFNADNINALQRDTTLSIPQGGTLRFPDRAAANREVARQLNAWQGPGQPLRATVTDPSPAPGDGPDEPVPSESVAYSAPLRLLTPEPTEPLAPGSGSEPTPASGSDKGVTEASLAELEAQLESVQASNERLSADNRALRSTLLDLQADMARLETLLTRDPASPSPSPSREGTVDAPEMTGAMVLDWVRGKLDWAAANPRAAVREPWVQAWLAGLGGLVMLVVLMAWRRRRRRRADRHDDRTLPSDWRPRSGRSVAEEPSVETTLGETSVRGAGSEPVEPLERASELIAYGRLEQAQAVLDDALGEEPDSIELRLKLLDVLAMREDRAGFESEAHVLQAQINDDDDGRWQDVARKGRILSPEHPLFRA